MANILKREKRIQVLNCLVEGNSIRATARITKTSKNTVLKLLVEVGEGCAVLHDVMVWGVESKNLQFDEIWAYVGKKMKRCSDEEKETGLKGDAYTFTAIDRDSKLALTWLVGKRDGLSAAQFCQDAKDRLIKDCRPQVSSDAFKAYPDAIEDAFGSDVDYGQIVKDYVPTEAGRGRYSPGKVISISKHKVSGKPDMKMVCTSHVERANLTMRMGMRRFTRLTNAFSKKLDNLKAAVALHFMHYNFCRIHMTIEVTPAMEAGIADHVWSMGELLDAAMTVREQVVSVAA